MYEHPIKRAGLSMNRIIFSNTKMVMQGFPTLKEQQFRLSFNFKTFENGKLTSMKRKLPMTCADPLTVACLLPLQVSRTRTSTMFCPPGRSAPPSEPRRPAVTISNFSSERLVAVKPMPTALATEPRFI